MTVYAVALTVKDPAPFLSAWRALNNKGISTQLDQNIAPHVGLGHGDFDEKTFSATDFWQKTYPIIEQAALNKVETVYDAATVTRGGALLARPIFPNGFEALVKTQTAILEGYGWTAEQQKAWKERGLHLSLGTGIPKGERESATDAVYEAWGESAKIVTGFSAIALYSFDPAAKKFSKLLEYGFAS